MSSAKAALEADTRTLAFEAGRRWGVRINAISAGPWASRAASAIGFIDTMIKYTAANSPLPTADRRRRGGPRGGVPLQPARLGHHRQRGLRRQRLPRDGHGGPGRAEPMPELLSEAGGAVHRLTLNRPARRNALTPDLARAIAEQLDLRRGVGPGRGRRPARGRRPLLRRAGSPLAPRPGRVARHRRPAARTGRLPGGGAGHRPLSGAGPRGASRVRRRGSGSTSPSPATCGSPPPTRASPPPSPAWAWCPTAARPSPCPGSSASARRFGCCSRARRSTPPARRPSGWSTKSSPDRCLDDEVAALVQRLTAGASVERPRDQAAGPRTGGRRAGAGPERPRGPRSSRRSRAPEFHRRLEAFAARLAARAEGA